MNLLSLICPFSWQRTITIYDEKTFNEYENKNEELILATDEGNVFYSSTPLDSGIDNEEAAEEYTNLNINHVKVKELFSIDCLLIILKWYFNRVNSHAIGHLW